MLVMADKNDIPMFLAKLWNFVDDASTDHLIRWGADGTSFIMSDPARFAKDVLPQYFKHRNISSFIRVLNMYGFRKVVRVDSGSLRSNRDDMEFKHPFFVRGNEHLLIMIKRKPPASRGITVKAIPDGGGLSLAPSGLIPEQEVTRVLSDVRSLRNNQESMDAKLDTLKQENEAMWAELQDLRSKHQHQQIVVNKLIEFFVTLLNGTGSVTTSLRAAAPQLAIKSLGPNSPVASAGKRQRIDSGAVAVADGTTAKNGAPAQNGNYHGPVIRDVTDVWGDYSQQNPVELDWDRLLQKRIADLNGRTLNGQRRHSSKQPGPGQPGTPRPSAVQLASPQQAVTTPVPRTLNAVAKQPQNAMAGAVQLLQITPDQIAALRNIPVTNVVARSQPVSASQMTVDHPEKQQRMDSSMTPPPQSSLQLAVPPQSTSPLESSNLEHQVDSMQSRLDSIRDVLQDPSYNLDLNQLLNLFNDPPNASSSSNQILSTDPMFALQNGTIDDGHEDGILDIDQDDFLREFDNLPNDDLIEGVTIQIPEYPNEVPPAAIPLIQPQFSVPAITAPPVKPAITAPPPKPAVAKRKRK